MSTELDTDRSVTIEDHLPPSGLKQIWPRVCSQCGVVCHDLDELTDEGHHDWPRPNQMTTP